jgi:hypothetical protein
MALKYSGGVAKVAWERAIRNVGDARDFGHQLGLLDLIKVDQIDHIRSPRHQQQPGKIRIIDDQHTRESGRSPKLAVSRSSCGWSFQAAGMSGISGAEPKGRGYLTRRVNAALAFVLCSPDIEAGRLAVDEPLANRVRSGRKQP